MPTWLQPKAQARLKVYNIKLLPAASGVGKKAIWLASVALGSSVLGSSVLGSSNNPVGK